MHSRWRPLSSAASLCLVFLLAFSIQLPVSAEVYQGRPKLIVIVVIDQFRGDYLNRYHDDFKGRGFKLFMDEGAWFTDCYYDYANTKTAPGHATIGTGAYTDGHGIDSNEWWDASRSDKAKVSSVEDERYQLVDLPAASIPANVPGAPPNAPAFLVGASPRNLRATTLGDEIRLATRGRSRVYGISLKDRAAILPAGQSANGAFWIDNASGQFTTSTYYMEHLPEWAREFNSSGRIAQAAREANVEGTTEFFDLVGHTPAANSYELDFAKALINGEKLGQGATTDLLTISLSANDLIGHQFGPDSDLARQMVVGLDRDLDAFFAWLDKSIGLKNVWLALSADHGVAPIPGEAAKLGINSAAVNLRTVFDDINTRLNARYSPQAKTDYLMPGPELPYIVLNRHAFQSAGLDEKAAEEMLAALLPDAVAALAPRPEVELPLQQRQPPMPQVAGVYTRLQLANGQLPPSEWGRLLAHSYTEHGNWYVMLILSGYQVEGASAFHGTTHFSPWSYDRHVPLAFYGAPFQPGEYHERVAPVDLAVTFASLAGVNQPSAAVGRVLTEALKPVH
ncbi:MAG: phosphodiesterase [Proteobacteria bacterium]|nr:MAG: phosphodiesterase [Pseudomonadota bacterium]